MTKTILILGGSLAGTSVAHALLKKTLNTVKGYKVVLVSTSTHLYWNLASIRAIIPGQFGDEKVFSDLQAGFKQYPRGSFELVIGAATALDDQAKSIVIKTAAGQITQSYDVLILATGTRTVGDLPWKASPAGYEATKDILHQYRDLVKSAKSIVIGGGGPTGVEVTGELGYEYGRTKNITLMTAAPQLCADCIPINIAKIAEGHLKKMHVNIKYGVKITRSKTTADGKTELILDNGEIKTVDLYLPTIGVLPNSEYIPEYLKDAAGYAQVDQYLRVKGAANIWAVGDIVDIEPSQLVYLEKQVVAISKNLDLVLKGKQAVEYKTGGDRIVALSLGRSKATGRAGNMKLPGFLIWYMKGRTLGTQNMLPYVNGTKF